MPFHQDGLDPSIDVEQDPIKPDGFTASAGWNAWRLVVGLCGTMVGGLVAPPALAPQAAFAAAALMVTGHFATQSFVRGLRTLFSAGIGAIDKNGEHASLKDLQSELLKLAVFAAAAAGLFVLATSSLIGLPVVAAGIFLGLGAVSGFVSGAKKPLAFEQRPAPAALAA